MNNTVFFPEPSAIAPRRRRLGITQQKLAHEASISQSMLAKIESGKVQPGYAVARRIFEVLEADETRDGKAAGEVMHGPVIALESSDTVEKAAKIAHEKQISQFPIMRDGVVVGSIRTSELVGLKPEARVGWSMSEPFPSVGKKTPISSIIPLVKTQQAVIVIDGGKMIGIITADDLI